jgi:acetyl esterase/lipase
MGSNRSWGLYPAVAEFLAGCGVVVVLPNYRLAPGVKHPAQVEDVARAFAWTCAHVAEHGGDPRSVFVAGHSAGGHLASLLATDEQYLAAQGLSTADVKGVIAFSGVYAIPPGRLHVALGGEAPESFRLDQLLPVRSPADWTCTLPGVPGIPLSVDVFQFAFGTDPQARRDASPLARVRPGLPPFLLFCAEHDLPGLPSLAEEFHQALLARDVESRLVRVPRRNHHSVLFAAIEPNDPVARAVLTFLHTHAPSKP